jgi:putative transposase
MKAFINQHRDVYGVEPICKVLPIAPSTYYLQVARESDPAQRSARAQRDERLCGQIQQVWDENLQLTRFGGNCGAKAWMWPAARWSG